MKKYYGDAVEVTRREVKYYHTMTFIGKGVFPIDMLRYDQCFPTKEGEPLAGESHNFRPEDFSEFRIIRVAKFSSKKDPNKVWAFERWGSFGWHPVPWNVTCDECGKEAPAFLATFYGQGPSPKWLHGRCAGEKK